MFPSKRKCMMVIAAIKSFLVFPVRFDQHVERKKLFKLILLWPTLQFGLPRRGTEVNFGITWVIHFAQNIDLVPGNIAHDHYRIRWGAIAADGGYSS